MGLLLGACLPLPRTLLPTSFPMLTLISSLQAVMGGASGGAGGR